MTTRSSISVNALLRRLEAHLLFMFMALISRLKNHKLTEIERMNKPSDVLRPELRRLSRAPWFSGDEVASFCCNQEAWTLLWSGWKKHPLLAIGNSRWIGSPYRSSGLFCSLLIPSAKFRLPVSTHLKQWTSCSFEGMNDPSHEIPKKVDILAGFVAFHQFCTH